MELRSPDLPWPIARSISETPMIASSRGRGGGRFPLKRSPRTPPISAAGRRCVFVPFPPLSGMRGDFRSPGAPATRPRASCHLATSTPFAMILQVGLAESARTAAWAIDVASSPGELLPVSGRCPVVGDERSKAQMDDLDRFLGLRSAEPSPPEA